MAMKERPEVRAADGGKCWEHRFDRFYLKAYVPDNDLNGQVNNYGFRAPLLLVFEERPQSMESAVIFARESGLKSIAARYDTSVLFVYPTSEGGWAGEDAGLYRSLIAEIKMIQTYRDGIVENWDFFTRSFRGYFVRGAIFRADIYSFGASADYAAKNLLTTVEGEYLWGPGEITPAVCSMERLSVVPDVRRRDIPVISVGNTAGVDKAFEGCEHLLIKRRADYEADFDAFVKRFRMWCGRVEIEPDLKALHMTEEPGYVTVNTSPDNVSAVKGTETHDVGYFAYYNDDLFSRGPAPLVIGFHGGGDSSMYLTFVAGWWDIARRHDLLFVSVENHQFVTAAEAAEMIGELKRRYPVDPRRVYATGFSMGSGKTWDLYQQYPELLAGVMPCSALFPVRTTLFGEKVTGRINEDVPVPVFYSGGEESPLPELPSQGEGCVERVKYVAAVNGLKKDFGGLDFQDKENWEDRFMGIPGDRVEKIYDPTRDSTLTVRYYDSRDGVCRTAFAGVSGQMHECRMHSCENAWKFISRFSR